MALRRTKKEAGLENTLPKRVDGPKAHLKGGRVRKHTTYEVRARRHTKKEVVVRHWSVKDESNASWTICMYTYLRNIGPLFFMEFFFSQKFESLIVSFDGFCPPCLLEKYLTLLASRKDLMSSFLCSPPFLSQGLPILPNNFLERESWSQLYQMFFIAP